MNCFHRTKKMMRVDAARSANRNFFLFISFPPSYHNANVNCVADKRNDWNWCWEDWRRRNPKWPRRWFFASNMRKLPTKLSILSPNPSTPSQQKFQKKYRLFFFLFVILNYHFNFFFFFFLNPHQLGRFFLVSDVLYNSSAKAVNASNFRSG